MRPPPLARRSPESRKEARTTVKRESNGAAAVSNGPRMRPDRVDELLEWCYIGASPPSAVVRMAG